MLYIYKAPWSFGSSQELQALLYLDDNMVAITGKEAAEQASRQVRDPTLKLKWLSFDLNLEAGLILVPEDKLAALKSQQPKTAT